MAPLNTNTVGHFGLCPYGVRTILALCFCVCTCVLLLIRRYKDRHSRRAIRPDDEHLVSSSTMEEKHLGAMTLDPADPISPLDRQLLTELLSPLMDGHPRAEGLITSGYLAAKAKMEMAKTLAGSEKVLDQREVADFQSRDIEQRSVVEHQKLQWSRRSSPGPQIRVIPRHDTSNYEEMEHLIRISSLHNESKHDQTEYFCDDHNTRIKWRRRTLIFEKMP